jgi:hypothetical protein
MARTRIRSLEESEGYLRREYEEALNKIAALMEEVASLRRGDAGAAAGAGSGYSQGGDRSSTCVPEGCPHHPPHAHGCCCLLLSAAVCCCLLLYAAVWGCVASVVVCTSGPVRFILRVSVISSSGSTAGAGTIATAVATPAAPAPATAPQRVPQVRQWQPERGPEHCGAEVPQDVLPQVSVVVPLPVRGPAGGAVPAAGGGQLPTPHRHRDPE